MFRKTLKICVKLSLSYQRAHAITYTYNKEGKITENWLANEESIFFLILLCEEGKITRSRLVLRLPNNSLFCPSQEP